MWKTLVFAYKVEDDKNPKKKPAKPETNDEEEEKNEPESEMSQQLFDHMLKHLQKAKAKGKPIPNMVFFCFLPNSSQQIDFLLSFQSRCKEAETRQRWEDASIVLDTPLLPLCGDIKIEVYAKSTFGQVLQCYIFNSFV